MSGLLQRTVGNLLRTIGNRPGSGSNGVGSSDEFSFPVYLVNLPRAKPRRKFALGQLADIGATPVMVDAVDGRELNLDQLIADGFYDPEKADEAFSRQLSLPEIGCSMSHYNIYQKIVERDDPVSLVLEDDALLLPGFADKLQLAYQELPQGWGLLNLNCPCKRYERVGQTIVKYDGVGSLPVASSAYLISKLGAELMLDNTLPLRYPADSLVGRGLRWGVETYGVVPAITSINNVFPTQIQPPIGVVGWTKATIKNTLARLLFR